MVKKRAASRGDQTAEAKKTQLEKKSAATEQFKQADAAAEPTVEELSLLRAVRGW